MSKTNYFKSIFYKEINLFVLKMLIHLNSYKKTDTEKYECPDQHSAIYLLPKMNQVNI